MFRCHDKKKLALTLIFLLFLVATVKADSGDPWVLPHWNYRVPLTVDADLIDSDLTDFPVLVYLNNSIVNWDHIDDDLGDIRFYDLNNNSLPYEIESYTVNTDAWLWVSLDIDDTDDTTFYLYYGNEEMPSVEDKTGVWDANFVMIQHMADENTTAILDSTTNDNDGLKKGANTPLEISGKIGPAQKFNSANSEYINLGNNEVIRNDLDGNCLIESWVNFTGSTTLYAVIASTSNAGGQDGYAFNIYELDVRPQWDDAVSYARAQTTNQITANSWVYIAVTYNGLELEIYVNGVQQSLALDDKFAVTLASSKNVYFGARNGGTENFFAGSIDETRISLNTLRSGAWIKASYYSGDNTLLSYGEIENQLTTEEVLGIALIFVLIFFAVAVGIALSRR